MPDDASDTTLRRTTRGYFAGAEQLAEIMRIELTRMCCAVEKDFDGATMDACLIAAGQRAEHYEMAAYGTLVAWARAMGHSEAAKLLQETLDEEKAADEKLTTLAEGGINREAAAAAHPADEEKEEEADEVTPERAGRSVGRHRQAVAAEKRSARR